MPAYSPASATEPAGTRGRGAASRGTAHSSRRPRRYAKPGAKPQNATVNPVSVKRATAASADMPQPNRVFDYSIGRRPGFIDGRPGYWWTINGRMWPDVPMFMVRKGDVVKFSIDNLVIRHSGRRSTSEDAGIQAKGRAIQIRNVRVEDTLFGLGWGQQHHGSPCRAVIMQPLCPFTCLDDDIVETESLSQA